MTVKINNYGVVYMYTGVQTIIDTGDNIKLESGSLIKLYVNGEWFSNYPTVYINKEAIRRMMIIGDWTDKQIINSMYGYVDTDFFKEVKSDAKE